MIFISSLKKAWTILIMADNHNQGENSRGWYAQMGKVRVLVEAIKWFRSRERGQTPLSPPLGGHSRVCAPALLWQMARVHHTHATSSVPYPRGRGLGSLSLSPPYPGSGDRASDLPLPPQPLLPIPSFRRATSRSHGP